MSREFMPILRHPEFSLPWALIAPHEQQAMKNHGQSLERLAERGGLSFTEAAAIMTGFGLFKIRHDKEAQDNARAWLEQQIAAAQPTGKTTDADGVREDSIHPQSQKGTDDA